MKIWIILFMLFVCMLRLWAISEQLDIMEERLRYISTNIAAKELEEQAYEMLQEYLEEGGDVYGESKQDDTNRGVMSPL